MTRKLILGAFLIAAITAAEQASARRDAITADVYRGGNSSEEPMQSDPACVPKALAVLKFSPTAARNYRALDDKSFFMTFIDQCSDANEFYSVTLPTAAHESNHMVRNDKQSYLLASGEYLAVPSATNFFAPKSIASLIRSRVGDDEYVQTYIDGGQASSADDFTYLLDELNAYTNDQQVSVEFATQQKDQQRQIGLAALMTYLATYAEYARVHAPAVYAQMSAPGPMRDAIWKIWPLAELNLYNSCRMWPDAVMDDSAYLKSLCDSQRMSALAGILGRAAWCPIPTCN